jgi:GT2 family glycosyltransferase
VTLSDLQPTLEASVSADDNDARIDIGILTKGKPTLGMALTSLLLQEDVPIRIHVVDTSARPVINRDDVRFALRLATDRRVQCSYEYSGESDVAFSAGKARLIRALNGRHVCLMDDDVVVPSKALRQLLDTALQYPVYGYISPFCKNSPNVDLEFGARPPCSPGSLIYQDALVHRILIEYYETTVDVLDQRSTDQKVWETAFLTALFEVLDRPAIRQPDLVTYHLDYYESPRWIDEERTVIARSAAIAHALVRRLRDGTVDPCGPSPDLAPRAPARRSLVRQARALLPWIR